MKVLKENQEQITKIVDLKHSYINNYINVKALTTSIKKQIVRLILKCRLHCLLFTTL